MYDQSSKGEDPSAMCDILFLLLCLATLNDVTHIFMYILIPKYVLRKNITWCSD